MRIATAKLRPGRSKGLRYACELGVGLVLVSVVTRTWLVQGLMVPVTVSGGSMATGLSGPHCQIECQQCGHSIRYGIERPPSTPRVLCPNCRSYTSLPDAIVVQSGDPVIIDRTTYRFRHPRRWEVVVFRCPEKSQDYCVKRVVGLPGESVRIVSGDIYINGQLARKDFAQTRANAQLVYDASHRNPSRPPRWKSEAENARWQTTEGGFTLAGPAGEKSAKPEGDWLFYHHAGGQPIRDDYGYNQGESRLLNLVSDIGISGHFVTSDSGMLQLKASDGQDWFHLQLATAEDRLTLLRNENFVISLEVDLSSLNTGAAIEFWLVDRQVMLSLDQQTVLRYPIPPSRQPRMPSAQPLALTATGRSLEIRQLKVWRDIYYTDPGRGQNRWGLDQAFLLGTDQYFLLGDNSPISHDSRTQGAGAISGKFLVGKPLGVR